MSTGVLPADPLISLVSLVHIDDDRCAFLLPTSATTRPPRVVRSNLVTAQTFAYSPPLTCSFPPSHSRRPVRPIASLLHPLVPLLLHLVPLVPRLVLQARLVREWVDWDVR